MPPQTSISPEGKAIPLQFLFLSPSCFFSSYFWSTPPARGCLHKQVPLRHFLCILPSSPHLLPFSFYEHRAQREAASANSAWLFFYPCQLSSLYLGLSSFPIPSSRLFQQQPTPLPWSCHPFPFHRLLDCGSFSITLKDSASSSNRILSLAEFVVAFGKYRAEYAQSSQTDISLSIIDFSLSFSGSHFYTYSSYLLPNAR